MNGFKANLRAALTSRRLTVGKLSAITGVAKGTLDCYLGARASIPPADVAAKIASALGVTVEYLVSGHEAKAREKNIGAIFRLLVELDERDVETVLAVTKTLKAQAGKN
ncbi:MAG: helix-turn-helix domain-containing protein [Treponema sp.]|nr:helix-turn-helix domain-containing protein [Treponema sp.]